MKTAVPTNQQIADCPAPIFSHLARDPDLAEIVALYVEEMPERIERLQRLLAAGEWNELRRAAHQLKGSAGSHGFEPVSLRAAELETALKSGASAAEVHAAVARLVDICRAVRAGVPD